MRLGTIGSGTPRIERRTQTSKEDAMAGQEHQRPRDRDDDPEDVAVPTAPQSQTKDEDVDALLDEIDDVLETNAEEFVKGFVQKGGQ
jgi:prokaryotic ubiquitin-like protein Pup